MYFRIKVMLWVVATVFAITVFLWPIGIQGTFLEPLTDHTLTLLPTGPRHLVVGFLMFSSLAWMLCCSVVLAMICEDENQR